MGLRDGDGMNALMHALLETREDVTELLVYYIYINI